MQEIFTNESGANILRQLTFEQQETNVVQVEFLVLWCFAISKCNKHLQYLIWLWGLNYSQLLPSINPYHLGLFHRTLPVYMRVLNCGTDWKVIQILLLWFICSWLEILVALLVFASVMMEAWWFHLMESSGCISNDNNSSDNSHKRKTSAMPTDA